MIAFRAIIGGMARPTILMSPLMSLLTVKTSGVAITITQAEPMVAQTPKTCRRAQHAFVSNWGSGFYQLDDSETSNGAIS